MCTYLVVQGFCSVCVIYLWGVCGRAMKWYVCMVFVCVRECVCETKLSLKSQEVAEWVKVFAAKFDDPSLITGTHTTEGKNYPKLSSAPHLWTVACTYTHTQNQS